MNRAELLEEYFSLKTLLTHGEHCMLLYKQTHNNDNSSLERDITWIIMYNKYAEVKRDLQDFKDFLDKNPMFGL